jgi:ArsR family transcriptional regulator
VKQGRAIAALGALAQETRLDIFRLLVEQGRDGLAAGMIAEQLKLPAPTLSFHLNQLKNAGLVKCRRNGRSLIYTANYPTMRSLISYLTDSCCGGHPEACGFRVCAPTVAPRDSRQGDLVHEAPARLRRSLRH